MKNNQELDGIHKQLEFACNFNGFVKENHKYLEHILNNASSLNTRGVMKLDVLIDALRRVGLAMDDENWATINGAHVKLNDNGQLQGAVGEKIQQNHEQAQARRSIARHRVKLVKQAIKQSSGKTSKTAVKLYQKFIQGKTSKCKIDGKTVNVKYSSVQNNDFSVNMNNKNKLFFIPFIGDVVETGQNIGKHLPTHDNDKKKYNFFHTFKKEIDVPGFGPRKVLLHVGELKNGTYEYRFKSFMTTVEKGFSIVESLTERKIASLKKQEQAKDQKERSDNTSTTFGKSELRQTFSPIGDAKISNNDMVVNLFFEDELEAMALKKEIRLLVSALKKIAA